MIVVSDTSPITNLLKIDRVKLLHSLYGVVVVPFAVASEINFIEENRRSLILLDWIETVELKDRRLYNTLLKQDLDKGEAEAIALSLELSADLLLIDETLGRVEARNRGVEVTGLIGVLLESKKVGLIDCVKPEIQRLSAETSFWMSPQLVELALALAGEN